MASLYIATNNVNGFKNTNKPEGKIIHRLKVLTLSQITCIQSIRIKEKIVK